jgi:hypothetical protein
MYMAESKSRIEIPPYIVRTEDRQKYVESFSGKLQACNNAYKSLLAMPDLENISDNLKEISSESIEAFINERLAEISSTKMLTSSQKDAAKEEWKKVKEDALSYIGTIKEFLATFPDADITVNKGEVVCINFDDVVVEHCKVKTPEGVTEWASLILGARDAIDALWNFERAHDLQAGTLISLDESMKRLENPTSLVEAWLFMEWRKDYIKKHPYLQGAYQTSMKNGLKEQNDRLAEMRKKHLEEHPEDFVQIAKRDPYENQRDAVDCLGYSVEMK